MGPPEAKWSQLIVICIVSGMANIPPTIVISDATGMSRLTSGGPSTCMKFWRRMICLMCCNHTLQTGTQQDCFAVKTGVNTHPCERVHKDLDYSLTLFEYLHI